MSGAIDLDQVITPRIIAAMGVNKPAAACRYTKNVTLTEVKLLSGAGIKSVMIAEWRGNLYSSYTVDQGVTDAKRALDEVKAVGMPLGVIYFCGADFDANNSQIAGGITAYFKGVNSVLAGTGYTAGVYGNGAVCQAMLDAKLATHAWLWGVKMSNGTPAFLASNRWSIHQYVTTTEYGVSVDPDDVQGPDPSIGRPDYGGWLLAA